MLKVALDKKLTGKNTPSPPRNPGWDRGASSCLPGWWVDFFLLVPSLSKSTAFLCSGFTEVPSLHIPELRGVQDLSLVPSVWSHPSLETGSTPSHLPPVFTWSSGGETAFLEIFMHLQAYLWPSLSNFWGLCDMPFIWFSMLGSHPDPHRKWQRDLSSPRLLGYHWGSWLHPSVQSDFSRMPWALEWQGMRLTHFRFSLPHWPGPNLEHVLTRVLMNGAGSIGWGWRVKISNSRPEAFGLSLMEQSCRWRQLSKKVVGQLPGERSFCVSEDQQSKRTEAAPFTGSCLFPETLAIKEQSKELILKCVKMVSERLCASVILPTQKSKLFTWVDVA